MQDLISIVIPVYNVAAYLPQCLDSILLQDHKALEVLLVDDGSTDESGRICDAYADRDDRVKVIHQKNSGAAAAKNAALRLATGQYLSFVDSDDYLEPNVYSYMLQVLQKEQADAAQFAFRDVYQTYSEDQILHPGRQILDNKTYLTRFPKDWSCALLWNKLYKRSLFEGVFFEEGHKIDDEYFTYRGFLKPCRVVLDDRIIYNYRRRASSVMASASAAEQRIIDCLDAIQKRREVVTAVYPDLRRQFDASYADALWYLSENPGNTEKTISMLKSGLKSYLTTKGNSLPPRYLWWLLTKMYFTRTETLLENCARKRQQADIADYFA